EEGERLGAVELTTPGRSGPLPITIDHLPDAGCPHWMPDADEAATGVDRHFATHFDHPLLNCPPRLPRLGQSEMVNGHVLRRGEAIVCLNAVKLPDRIDMSALERVENCAPSMRQD